MGQINHQTSKYGFVSENICQNKLHAKHAKKIWGEPYYPWGGVNFFSIRVKGLDWGEKAPLWGWSPHPSC